VAQAGFRPTGLDQSEVTGGDDEGTGSATDPATPPPDCPAPPTANDDQVPGGMGSSGSSPGPVSGGHVPGVIATGPVPIPTFVIRLWLARERVTVAAHLTSIFEPPRPVTSC
jgi:hypothetical protein